MTEKQIRNKLHLLQAIHPDDETLREVQQRLSLKLFRKKHVAFLDWLVDFISIPVGTVTLLALFFIIATGLLPQSLEQTQIMFAANQYEKAKIAYGYTNETFDSFTNNPKYTTVDSLSYSVAIANTEMIGLRLKGEKGEYTSQQCLILYAAYHKTLEQMKKTIALQIDKQRNNQSLTNLLAQVTRYDEESEKRLHKYKK